MWVPRPLWSPARKLGFHGSFAQATSISSMSGPPPAAAGHSVAPARGVRASGQPWSCARAGSAVPSRAVLVTCPQQPGAWPLVLGRRVSPRLACQFSMPAPHGFVGRVWHSPGRDSSFMAAAAPEERGRARACGLAGWTRSLPKLHRFTFRIGPAIPRHRFPQMGVTGVLPHVCSHRGTQRAQRRMALGWHVRICLWTNIGFCKMRGSERL